MLVLLTCCFAAATFLYELRCNAFEFEDSSDQLALAQGIFEHHFVLLGEYGLHPKE